MTGVSELDGEHDVVDAVLLQRGLELHERAGHRQRIPRRVDLVAQVVAVVGVGQRQLLADERRGEGDDRQHRRRPPGEPARRPLPVVTRRCAAQRPLLDHRDGERAGGDERALDERDVAVPGSTAAPARPSVTSGPTVGSAGWRAWRASSPPSSDAEPGQRERHDPQRRGQVGGGVLDSTSAHPW